MIWKIIKDINLREYFPSPQWCFPLGNLNCNNDCLACLGYPTVSPSWHRTDEVRLNECVDVPKKKDEIISKPSIIIKRNTYMGSVDKCDQYLSYYSLGRKSIKWWKKVFFCLFGLCIIKAMVVYFNKNIEFGKRRQVHKLFHEILAHELVQLLLDKHSNSDIDVVGPGKRSVNNDVRLKGKHISVSKHPMRKSCVACAYWKKLMANWKR